MVSLKSSDLDPFDDNLFAMLTMSIAMRDEGLVLRMLSVKSRATIPRSKARIERLNAFLP